MLYLHRTYFWASGVGEREKRLIWMNWEGAKEGEGRRGGGRGERVTYDSSDTFGNDVD